MGVHAEAVFVLRVEVARSSSLSLDALAVLGRGEDELDGLAGFELLDTGAEVVEEEDLTGRKGQQREGEEKGREGEEGERGTHHLKPIHRFRPERLAPATGVGERLSEVVKVRDHRVVFVEAGGIENGEDRFLLLVRRPTLDLVQDTATEGGSVRVGTSGDETAGGDDEHRGGLVEEIEAVLGFGEEGDIDRTVTDTLGRLSGDDVASGFGPHPVGEVPQHLTTDGELLRGGSRIEDGVARLPESLDLLHFLELLEGREDGVEFVLEVVLEVAEKRPHDAETTLTTGLSLPLGFLLVEDLLNLRAVLDPLGRAVRSVDGRDGEVDAVTLIQRARVIIDLLLRPKTVGDEVSKRTVDGRSVLPARKE